MTISSSFVAQIICCLDHLLLRSFVAQIICCLDHLLLRSCVAQIICCIDHLLLRSFVAYIICCIDHLLLRSFVAQITCCLDHLLHRSFIAQTPFVAQIICCMDHLLLRSYIAQIKNKRVPRPNLKNLSACLVPLKIVFNVSRFKPALNLNRFGADLRRGSNLLNSNSCESDMLLFSLKGQLKILRLRSFKQLFFSENGEFSERGRIQ